MVNELDRKIDLSLLGIALAICAVGLLALYSTTFQNGVLTDVDLFYKQLIRIAVGVFLYFLISSFGHKRILGFSYVLYGIITILLLLVIVAGTQRLGAQRWLSIFGFSLQPSEFAKIVTILFLTKYFSRFHNCCNPRANLNLVQGFLLPFVAVAFLALLIMLQPDLGTAFVLFPIFFVMVFYAGVRKRYLNALLVLGLAVVPFLWHFLKDYQKTRLMVFVKPDLDPLGAGYTIIQSKIAIGSGRLLGKGWLSGTQNQLNFLPERHTDFIFSVIGEEWGFLGSVLILGLFLVLIFKLLNSITPQTDAQSRLTILGVVVFFTTQILVNIAMTSGFMPVVGLPLPFVSYGGTSMLVSFIALGLASSANIRRRL